MGLYCYRGHLVYCLPKYEGKYELLIPEKQAPESSADRMAVFSLLMQVMRRYQSKCTENLGNQLQEQKSDDYLSQLVSIVNDYAENGEYRDDEQRIALNEHGRILWNRTINCTTPFMQDDEPVYMDVYTSRLVDAEDHFISRLHRVVVKECCRQLQVFGLVDLLDLPMIDSIEDDVEELGETEYLIHCVENELGCQFDSRRRQILHSLQAYLERERYSDDEAQDEYFFGSTSFHCIWEDVCRSTLGVDRREDFAICPPEWKIENVEKTMKASPLELDMLFIDKDKAYVMDAKYYLPCENEKGRLYGLPGVGDETKQFLYRQAIMKKDALEPASEREIPTIAYNAFLMPNGTSSESVGEVRHYASVTIPLFGAGERIDAYRLAAAPLYRSYVAGTKCDSISSALRKSLQENQSM